MIGFRLALGTLLLASPTLAEEPPPPCPSDTMPVVTLGFGSRYAADSANRSEFDEDSDKAVTAALKPIDDFIADLARQANLMNDPSTDPELATKAAACVEESLLAWARAGALSDLTTQGANLSAPSRVGGIAFAYAALRAHQPDAGGNPEIEAWLLARARQTIAFFDTEAPPKAAQNNLRAWAGLAVARIGLTLEDPVLIDWAETSVRLVACAAMGRRSPERGAGAGGIEPPAPALPRKGGWRWSRWKRRGLRRGYLSTENAAREGGTGCGDAAKGPAWAHGTARRDRGLSALCRKVRRHGNWPRAPARRLVPARRAGAGRRPGAGPAGA